MTDDRQLRTGRGRIIWLAQGAVSLALIGLLVSRIDATTIAAIKSVSVVTFGTAVVVYSLSQFWCAARLRMLIGRLDVHAGAPRLSYLVRLTLSTFFISNFLPGTIGGDVVKAVALTRNAVPLGRVVSALLMDRLTNVLAAMLLSVITVSIAAPTLVARVHISLGIVLALGGLLCGGVLGLLLLERLSKLFAYTVRALRDAAMSWLKSPLPVAIAIVLSIASLLSAVSAQWILASVLALPVTPLQLTAIICLVYIVTQAPVTLNGIGLQEVSTVVLLVQFGTPQGIAVTFALLTRLLVLALSLAGAVVTASDRQLYLDIRRGRETGTTSGFMQLFHESRLKRLFHVLGMTGQPRARR